MPQPILLWTLTPLWIPRWALIWEQLLLSLLSLLFFLLFLGGDVLDQANIPQFLLAVVLGGIGFAAVLTLISAIAARAGNGLGLMAILGFPLVLIGVAGIGLAVLLRTRRRADI